MTHFDEMTCLQYLDGQLDRARAAELAAHLDDCAGCRRLLAALERESGLLRAALVEEDEAVPARLLALPSRERVPWAWIVSFGLAALGGYFFWADLIQPWQSELSQAGFGQSSLIALLLFGGVFWKGWSDMLNVANLLAMLSLLTLGGFLLRRSLKRWTTASMILAGLGGLLLLPSPAGAADIRKGKATFVLSEGEVLKNDLIVHAETVKIDGTVEGDLIVFCETLKVNGRVTGDVLGFAYDLEINGTVDGNIRAGARNITVNGTVTRNLIAFGDKMDLADKSQVNGGVILFGGKTTIDGKIARDLLAFAGRNAIGGNIGGDATLAGERLQIASTAEIKGKTKFRGRLEPEVEEGAKLGSPVEHEKPVQGSQFAQPRFYFRQAVRWGGGFVMGLVLLLLFPSFFRETTRAGNRWGLSALSGLVVLILVPIVSLLVCLTLVGAGVALSTFGLWLVGFYASHVFFSAWLGSKLLGETENVGAMLGRLALGLLVYRVAVNLPYVGFWIFVVVSVLGMGAMTVAIYKRMNPEPIVS